MFNFLINGVGDLSERAFRASRARSHRDIETESPAMIAQRDLLETVKEGHEELRGEDELANATDSRLIAQADGKAELTPLGEYLLSAKPHE